MFIRALFLCARHVVYLGGESPLRAVMTGTASRSKGVRREAESEGSVAGGSIGECIAFVTIAGENAAAEKP